MSNTNQPPKSECAKPFANLMRDLVLALTVAVATAGLTAWVNKWQAVNEVKLGDSTTVTSKFGEIWETVVAFELALQRLDTLKTSQEMAKVTGRADADQRVAQIAQATDSANEARHKYQETALKNAYYVGAPLVEHFGKYVTLLMVYYGLLDQIRSIPELASNTEVMRQVTASRESMEAMRVDLRDIRAHALAHTGKLP